MSFLGFAFLFALPLAAAPILLHLFDRQRNVVIEWGAMQFLVEAARKRTSARQLQQWLLLLLRTLAIVCLVLALARPLINSNWIGAVDRRDTVIVIDNSLSMTRPGDNGTVFESLLGKVSDQIDQIPSGDTVRVLLTSPYPLWMTSGSVRMSGDARFAVRDQLKNQRPTHGRSDLLGSVFMAVQADVVPGTNRRKILVFTDGQAADWNTADEQGWQRLHEVLKAPPVPTDVNVITLNPSQAGTVNLAVNKIHANRILVGRQQAVAFSAQVQNHGNAPSEPCTLKWNVAGMERHRSQIPSLAAGTIHEVIWKSSFSTLGSFTVSGEIDSDDVLITDNRESVIVEVVDQIPVLVVESNPGAAEVLQDAYFLQAAMGWIDGEPLETQGVHVPTLMTPDQMQRIDFHEYRAIVIPSLTELNESLLRKLQNFVFEGGGLWIALGPRTDVERFNQFFYADADGLAALPIDRIVDDSDSNSPKPMIDPFVTGHPATASLADGTGLDTGKIAVTRRFRFSPPRPGDSISILLNLTNGDPLAVEKLVGRGRVIVQAIPLKLQWSELAKSQAFVVMVQDWLNYLTQPQATRHNLAPGDPITLQVAGTDVQDATLRTPQGDDIELTAEPRSGGVAFRSSRTIQPGDYSLEVGLTGDKIPFHVHRDPLESNLTPLNASEQNSLLKIASLGNSATDASSRNSMPSDPAWPLLLMLLVGLMLAELILSGSMSRRRFGADPITETSERLADEHSRLASSVASNHRPMADQRVEWTPPRT